MGLGHAAEKKPSQLSGGIKQRVGIARALAIAPYHGAEQGIPAYGYKEE